MRKSIIITLTVVSVICGAATARPVTYWRADPGVIGNWFEPGNWTAGVPSAGHLAFIENSGTTGIASGYARAFDLNVGTSRIGNVIQSGGTARISRALSLGKGVHSRGNYTLLDGRLFAGSIYVGRGLGHGEFTQLGGTTTVCQSLRLGDLPRYATAVSLNSSMGKYRLIGGELRTRATEVGTRGRGHFAQTGGRHLVEGLLRIGGPVTWFPIRPVADPVPLPTDSAEIQAAEPQRYAAAESMPIVRYFPSKGLYTLGGGRLSAKQQQINRTGTLTQTSGYNEAAYLNVRRGGRYNYLGGTLRIGAGFDLYGDLNFGGNNMTLAIGSGLLNFGRGRLLDSENTTITAGPNSLTIFAPGFDSDTQLEHFSSEGLVHFAGSDLGIGAEEGFTGWGTIHDHVQTKGWIRAAADGRIDLRNGLFVHQGRVDLGRGQLSVRNRRSGITDGAIAARSMAIGSPFLPATPYPIEEVPTVAEVAQADDVIAYPIWHPMFQQTGGHVSLSGRLNVNNGAYVLRDGEFAANSVHVGWERRYPHFWPHVDTKVDAYPYPYPHKARAAFVQTGGSSRIQGVLRIGGYRPLLIAHAEEIDVAETVFPEYGDYSEVATIYPYTGRPLPWPRPRTAAYHLAGGSLSVGSVWLGGCGRTRFTQTGGDLHVRNSFSIQGHNATYAVHGGSMEANVLSVGTRPFSSLTPVYPCRWAGTLDIRSADADISVARLSLGRGSRLTAVEGATIRITGPMPSPAEVLPRSSTVENFSTDPEALAGLNDLTLIFEGGDDLWDTLEVGGEDMGFSAAGFVENFALDTLQIGSESDVAQVRLVDLFDNQPDWEGDEALYVDTLIVEADSLLDLNGLHIYYMTGIFGDGAILSGGEVTATAIPEPATLGLLLLGGVVVLLRQRRRQAPA